MATTDGTSDEDDAPERPVGEDVPSGYAESTWWPVLAAAGAATLYVGVGLAFLGFDPVALIPSFVGPVVFVGGFGVVVLGLFGWLYQGFVEEFWSFDADSLNTETHRLGMLLFLVTDVATFSAGFVFYFFYRFGRWPPEHLPELLSTILIANTGILLLSSLTLHLGHSQLAKGNHRRFTALVGLTFVLGAVFLGGQVYEYYDFVVEKGFTISTGIFGGTFFALTGLHGLHVTLGTLLLGIVFVRSLYGQYGPDRDASVRTVTMYWHFVDAVWLFIVVALYFGGSLTSAT